MASAYTFGSSSSDQRVTRLDDDVSGSLERLDALARLLDSAVKIPGTDVRIGIDALIGIVPVFGDLASKAISAYLIMEARKLGASRWLIARMAANTTLDAIVGSVPVLGDAFDVMYRANEKNMALLRKHIERNGIAPSGRGPIVDARAERID